MGRPPRQTPIAAMQAEQAAQPAPAPIRRPMMKMKPNWEEFDEEPVGGGEDRYHISADLFPPGWAFQWITDSVIGQPVLQERAKFERGGWTPVHQEDFDGVFDGRFMPKGQQGEINVDGMVLMARPMEIHLRAKERERRAALLPMQVKQQQLTGGDLPGVTLDSRHPSATRSNMIKKTIEPVHIPRDDE